MAAATPDEIKQLEDVASRVFPGETVDAAERLGGLTNFTYAVTLPSGKYVFRLPGEGTEALINRHDEKVSSELADRLGIDAKLIYLDAESGIKVSECIDQAVTMSPESMREHRNITDAARLLRTLHECGEDTGVPFQVFAMAARYEGIMRDNGVSFYDSYGKVRAAVMAVKEKVDRFEAPAVPCHNDPLCENWVRDPQRLYLVDWEYAGMNDPLWDLADVSIEAGYTAGMDALLLETYFGHAPDSTASYRFTANKVYLDFLWSLWGKTRVPYDGDVMEEYALNRYIRLQENLAAMDQA